MRKLLVFVAVLMVGTFAACSSQQMSYQQTENAVRSIIQNQPVPNLGGFSFEREVVRQTMLARNTNVVSTYTYMLIETVSGGQIIEICASLGYPIPYGVQITSPTLPEANGLFYPDSAEASWVNCVNPDGSITPTYFEPRVFTLPYRITADRVLVRETTSTFTMQPK